MKKVFMQNTIATVFTIAVLVTFFFGSITSSSAKVGEGKECGHHKGKMFEETDTNADGVISLEENWAKAESRFKKMDTNSDGKVTREEAKSHHTAMREKYLQYHQENTATY